MAGWHAKTLFKKFSYTLLALHPRNFMAFYECGIAGLFSAEMILFNYGSYILLMILTGGL